ncbi:phage major capsid protein [Veillonella intestinalis]|uniref:phage major capsid protein n=1 Tax=Veillonella intestinalis TaxID=2941341 RepID=UPI00203BB604|nr:phage major capsid protein [Veillonella intestinalis]
MNRLNEIMNRKLEIRKTIENADSEALQAFKEELEALNKEEAELRSREAILNELKNDDTLGTDLLAKGEQRNMNFESMEYRKAFMEYVTKGTEIPSEFRALNPAITADNGAVLPTAVLNEIVTKLEAFGDILPRVRRVAFPAGVVVPEMATVFTAKWQNENAKAEGDKAVTGAITFNAYQLRCSAGVSFQMDVRSLSAFEATLIKNVSDAMGKALEKAIVAGSGVGQPTGILKATPVATVTVGSEFKVADIVKIVKAIPSAYKASSVLIMNEGTALSLISATDNANRAIGSVATDLSGKPQYKVFGKQIVLTDELPDIDAAAAGDTVILGFDLSRYMLNTAYDVDLRTYIDNETRAKVYDSVALVDGKVVDANGLVFVNKAAAK